ncbi:MAG TPA: hypothetical protein VN924_03410 [Bryobacteraceae bacterium]|nr:hypothetical protein [Bryobacteraceae bacterium]
MKKSLFAIVFAAASLPMIFAQSTTPATPSQSTPAQKSTTPAKKTTKKAPKHGNKKTTSSTSTPAQK